MGAHAACSNTGASGRLGEPTVGAIRASCGLVSRSMLASGTSGTHGETRSGCNVATAAIAAAGKANDVGVGPDSTVCAD